MQSIEEKLETTSANQVGHSRSPDADEFAHWSSTDFGTSARIRRKRREWQVFRALAEAREQPADVVAVESPGDRDVID